MLLYLCVMHTMLLMAADGQDIRVFSSESSRESSSREECQGQGRSSCEYWQFCRANSCQDVDLLPSGCTTDNECVPGWVCREKICLRFMTDEVKQI